MNESENSPQHNEVTVPMVEDTSSNADIPMEQIQREDNKNYDKHDNECFDMNGNHNNNSDNLQFDSAPSSANERFEKHQKCHQPKCKNRRIE